MKSCYSYIRDVRNDEGNECEKEGTDLMNEQCVFKFVLSYTCLFIITMKLKHDVTFCMQTCLLVGRRS
jgi:hypothetical protein